MDKIYIVLNSYSNGEPYEDNVSGYDEFVCACSSLEIAQERIKEIHDIKVEKCKKDHEYDSVTELIKKDDNHFSYQESTYHGYEVFDNWYNILEVTVDEHIDPKNV